MTTKDGKQSVQQVDREAAQEIIRTPHPRYTAENAMLKRPDSHPYIQLFAAHRQALITRLAEPDDAMIDAVARILFDEDEELCGTWDDNIDSVKHYSRQLAKAALTAVANVLEG